MLRAANKLRHRPGGEPGSANWWRIKAQGIVATSYQQKTLEDEWWREPSRTAFSQQNLRTSQRKGRGNGFLTGIVIFHFAGPQLKRVPLLG